MIDNIKNVAKQVRGNYTEEVADKLVLDNDITKLKKKDYIMRR